MPSWEEWTKYLDEQEQALEDTPHGSDEPDETPQRVADAQPAPLLDQSVWFSPEPEPAEMELSPTAPPPTSPAPSMESPVIERAPSRPSPRPVERELEQKADKSEAALVKKAVTMRKRLPRQFAGNIQQEQQEIAQRSYKGFKETRDELLERLLDPQLSLEDAARILNVCPTTVRRYTNRGLLKHLRTAGNQRRFRLSDVLAFMEAQSSGFPERMDDLTGE